MAPLRLLCLKREEKIAAISVFFRKMKYLLTIIKLLLVMFVSIWLLGCYFFKLILI